MPLFLRIFAVAEWDETTGDVVTTFHGDMQQRVQKTPPETGTEVTRSEHITGSTKAEVLGAAEDLVAAFLGLPDQETYVWNGTDFEPVP